MNTFSNFNGFDSRSIGYTLHYFSMIFSSLTSGAPSAITNLSAPIFGILGIIGFAIFAIGGKQDSDGQGTNSSPYMQDK